MPCIFLIDFQFYKRFTNIFRVIHTNYEGDAEWMIDWIQVKKGTDSVKIRSKEWLKTTNCDNRLQLDLYNKRGKSSQDGEIANFLDKTL